ncbi:hypothetical protein [Streptosporangium canum]
MTITYSVADPCGALIGIAPCAWRRMAGQIAGAVPGRCAAPLAIGNAA